MANELGAAELFLKGTLGANATVLALTRGGIFSGSAPRGATPPFVIFSFMSAPDGELVNAKRISTRPLYLVRAVGRTGQLSDLQPLADAIDAALQGSDGYYGGFRIAQCTREDAYTLTEATEEIPWKHLGGYYRLYISVQPS